MKLSILTGGYTHHFKQDLADVIDYYADIGYHALDLSLERKFEPKLFSSEWVAEADRIRAKLQERSMFFGQAHAPIIAYLDGVTQESKEDLIQCIRVCGYFNIPALVVHLLHVKGSDQDTFVQKNVEYYSCFLPYLDEYNVDMCFENAGNFLEKDLYCKDADQLLKVVNAFAHPHIHVCWDTGHANLYNLDQYPNIIKLGEHLKAVHVHDNHYPITTPDGEFAPDAHNFPLFGNINFDAFIQGLIDIGYKGTFSTETDTPNRKGHRDFIYNGKSTLKLKPIPFAIRDMSEKMLFEICRYMLETYDLWEK